MSNGTPQLLFIRVKDLPGVLGVSRDLAVKISHSETFPAPRVLPLENSKTFGWPLKEIEAFLSALPIYVDRPGGNRKQ
jgi:predicted DNA-binding transcriptional regulator AlpA